MKSQDDINARKSVTMAFQDKCRECAYRCNGAFDESNPLAGHHCFKVAHGNDCLFRDARTIRDMAS